MLLLEDALLGDVDFVDGLRRRIVNFRGYCRLTDAPTLFVDQFDQLVALFVRDFGISLCHDFGRVEEVFCSLLLKI